MTQSSTRKILQKAHSPLKANVYLDYVDSTPVVVKDYSESPAWLRSTLCRFLLIRETRTLKKLTGVSGIPKYIGADSEFSYAMQFVEGKTPDHEILGSNPGLLNQLSIIVENMHARGVTHNDLRPNNLIVTPGNEVYLIDFGAVYYRPEKNNSLSWAGHQFFRFLTNTDNSKVARLKAIYRPANITAHERDLIHRTGFARNTTKWWKKYVLPIISPAKHRNK